MQSVMMMNDLLFHVMPFETFFVWRFLFSLHLNHHNACCGDDDDGDGDAYDDDDIIFTMKFASYYYYLIYKNLNTV